MTQRTPNADSEHGQVDTPRPASPAVSGQVANWLGGGYFAAVAAIALAGQAGAAVEWLGWNPVPATLAAATLELAGIALSARADFRRRLGERALAARTLSAGVAVFAVTFQWFGHNHMAGGFFAGMSALGYCLYLIISGDRRRDQLRADGKLPATPPAYEITQWVRHPLVTRRARALAKADPGLGHYGSLAAAERAIRVERRTAAISKALRRKVYAGRDPLDAELAVSTYDLDEIAVRVAASADYDGLAALIAADLTPDRVTAGRTDDVRRHWPWRRRALSATAAPPTTLAVPRAARGEQPGGNGSARRPDIDRTVVPITTPTTRRRQPGQAVRVEAANNEPTIEELADTLRREGGNRMIGRPAAETILRRVYGSCSNSRAMAAKNLHNSRLTADDEDPDDQEVDHEDRHALAFAGA